MKASPKRNMGGRPPIYGPEMLAKAQRYIAHCVDRLKLGENGRVISIGVNLPKAEGLARFLEVHRDTLYDWAKKYPEFSDILEAINQEQVERLINAGLAGTYNSTIAKLVLAKHGYKESVVAEHSGPEGKPIPILQVLSKKKKL